VKLKKDPLTGLLYLRLRGGQIEETLPWPGWEDSVYLDLDKKGTVLGVEFLSSEELDEFLEDYPHGIEMPERIEGIEDLPAPPTRPRRVGDLPPGPPFAFGE
jgi:uncharacterized protein YuzE